MNTHESNALDEVIEPGSDRSFGLVVGGVFGAVGAYQYLIGSAAYVWVLPPALILMLLACVAPSILHPLNIGWSRLGILLGRIVTPVVMFVVYAITIVPIGLALRLAGKDPLQLKREASESSYWIDRDPPGPAPESLKDQF